MLFRLQIFISTIFLFLSTFLYGAPPPENTPIGTMATISILGAEIESNLVVAYVVYGDADITIKKEWGSNEGQENQMMIFKIFNGGWRAGQDLVLSDDITEKYDIVGTFGIWVPFGKKDKLNLTLAQDDFESNDKNVDLSYNNGILKFIVKNIPHQLETDSGGYLGIYVKPKKGISSGTILSNIANFQYKNKEILVNGKTNTLLYIVPIIAEGSFAGEVKEYGISGETFIFRNKLKNLGNTDDIFEISLENNNFPKDSIISIGIDKNGIFTLLEDKNNNGKVETSTLKPNEEIEIQLKVQTTSSDLAKNNISVEKVATSLNIPNYQIKALDKIIRLESSISSATLIKYQGLDANGDNKIDSVYTEEVQKGNPGDKIFYKLVFKNIGTDIVKDIEIEDTIPTYTKMNYGDGGLNEGGKPIYKMSNGGIGEILNKPPAGFNGSIKMNFEKLSPGEWVEIYYNVKIDK